MAIFVLCGHQAITSFLFLIYPFSSAGLGLSSEHSGLCASVTIILLGSLDCCATVSAAHSVPTVFVIFCQPFFSF